MSCVLGKSDPPTVDIIFDTTRKDRANRRYFAELEDAKVLRNKFYLWYIQGRIIKMLHVFSEILCHIKKDFRQNLKRFEGKKLVILNFK